MPSNIKTDINVVLDMNNEQQNIRIIHKEIYLLFNRNINLSTVNVYIGLLLFMWWILSIKNNHSKVLSDPVTGQTKRTIIVIYRTMNMK
jgi:hypothetical protein